MRFVWRGAIAIEARGFEFNLAASKSKDIDEGTEQLSVAAARARVQLGFGGQLRIALGDVTGACLRVSLPNLWPDLFPWQLCMSPKTL